MVEPAAPEPAPSVGANGLAVAVDPTEVVGVTPEGDAEVDRGPRGLSPSSASTFEQCARRWRFRYVERLPDPPGVPALVGTFVHRVLEELMAASPADRTVEHARTMARQLWPEIDEHPAWLALELDDDAARRVRWDAWRLLESYFRLEDPSTVEVVEREQRIECDLDGVPFVGIVDLVERRDGQIVVTDYKTGKAPTPRYEAGRLHQVQLYAAALDATGVRADSARLLYVRSRSIDVAVTDESLAAATGSLRGTWDAIAEAQASDEFPVRTGPLCNWCPYQDRCPEGRAEVERRYGPPV